MADLTTIILTFNEELNIRECIESVKMISKRIVVIDSYSTDKTLEIARNLGADIYQNTFINHSEQFKFGIEVADISTQWVLKIDADERLTELSSRELEMLCDLNAKTDINGIVVRFEVSFLGRKLRHGGIYPFRKLSVFKHGFAEIEIRSMDEHIYLTSGKSVELKNDSIHNDFKDISAWIDKHNKYSTKEVMDYFNKASNNTNTINLFGKAKYKRFLKYKLYYKLPMGLRAFLYFVYRYFILLGFLDGKEGFIFNFLQAFWYRLLVDAKIFEYTKSLQTKE